ncbi:DUF3325 domain-containing protein [Comamonas terrigena]|uniref:DUF3325 domain-containing protein n=1 Tax=Comamonas terrigena TaxID=32013 RepID=UPI00289A77C6|nr:DUF3325 domain-containing protein [Comamonas terrigena]
MNTGLAFLLSWALALAGMAALALAIDRHHGQLHGDRELSRRRAMLLQLAGVLLLAAAVVPCVQAWGSTVGTVAWLGCLSAGALAVAWGLSVSPRSVAWLALLAAPAALAVWLGCGGWAA